MKDEVKITLDPHKNKFVLRFGKRTWPLSPAQFEELLEASLAAASTHQNAVFRKTGQPAPLKPGPIDALATTQMEAIADLGAQNIVTRMHLGVLRLNFACPRQTALDYCHQMLLLIQAAETGQAQPMQ
jgi:hypothetical protein